MRLPFLKGLFLACLVLLSFGAQAQDHSSLIQAYLNENAARLGLSQADVSNWVLTDAYTTTHNQVTHLYIRQTHNNIEVYNAAANLTLWNGQIVSVANRMIPNLAASVNGSQPGITPMQAIQTAATQLELGSTTNINVITGISPREFIFSTAGISLENIPVKLSYLPMPEGEVNLVWDLSIATLDGEHWWSVRVDANSGSILDKDDWVVQCNFDHTVASGSAHVHSPVTAGTEAINSTETYKVFATPTESPNHGPRTSAVHPADAQASPYGWHDTDGTAGAEYTITRGNNVLASEDADADNVPGYSPDGGANLIFDYPLNLTQNPNTYFDASITNLFYWNNIIHDVWYKYGFDEASGNFQENNYGKGGLGNDYVNADGQDGGGLNNANFGTPPDGGNPRMQMFLWSGGGSGLEDLLTINNPALIAGNYPAAEATFGPGITSSITSNVVLVDDNTGNSSDGCDPIVNGTAISGKIAVIDRGGCTFVVKVEAAQAAGAIAVIVINNTALAPFPMGGSSPTITIPSVMISQNDGNLIKTQLAAATTVNVTLLPSMVSSLVDGDFDNGIIMHEYGHGVTNRLTGGPANAGCLGNAEQMGEGWSDWFGLMMTLDTANLVRPVGTFATSQPTTGTGIRNAPYAYDFSINNFTYASTNNATNLSQPHGIGFVWGTMLWDLTLDLMDQYGFDPDIYNGSGGNNMAMQLVIDGLKLQPCNPGFVDGRDAILLADQINYGGANQCLIWSAFARRGLGVNADQGSPNSRSDQVEDFNIPTTCLTAITPPSAAFSPSSISDCNGVFNFTDASTDIPQAWFWDFGDGHTDSIQNPSHTYTAAGSYTVTLIVTNTLGADTTTTNVLASFPSDPVVTGMELCAPGQATLSATATAQVQWFDANGNFLDTGMVYMTPVITTSAIYQVQNVQRFPSQKIGPFDGSFDTGGYHNSGFTGTLNFVAQEALTLVSAWLDAGSAGTRTIYVWKGSNGGGTVVDSVILNLASGPQRVMLNLDVPAQGNYSVGGTSVDLFRNNAGASYPYVIAGLMEITSSSANTDPAGYYYYLYDIDVEKAACRSPLKTIEVTVSDVAFTYSQSGSSFSFTDQSSNANSWAWDFGDGNGANQQNPTYSYTSNGTFVVTLAINGGNCVAVDTVTNGSTAIDDELAMMALALVPNPTTGLTTLTLSEALSETLTLEIVSLDGRILQVASLRAGQTSHRFDLSQLESAMYFVRMKSESFVRMEKLIVSH